jgi:SAM-dependent methyltransferase
MRQPRKLAVGAYGLLASGLALSSSEMMSSGEASTGAANLAAFSASQTVQHYADAEGLDPAEQALFARYLVPGMAVLDIGVGGGRTTPYLSSVAQTYVGIDYSTEMIRSCRRKFPGVRFEVCDASDMSLFGEQSFDAAVFSFNGIDYLPTGAARARCLAEVVRILVAGGVFIFSSHNARALGVVPRLQDARGLKVGWRIVRAATKSVQLASRNLWNGVFQAGEGYVWDPHHGGLWTYCSTPQTLRPQLRASGLEVVDMASGVHPRVRMTYLVPWHYYACRRDG